MAVLHTSKSGEDSGDRAQENNTTLLMKETPLLFLNRSRAWHITTFICNTVEKNRQGVVPLE